MKEDNFIFLGRFFVAYILYKRLYYRIAWGIIETLCVNTLNPNSLFTHCLRKGKKKGVVKFATP